MKIYYQYPFKWLLIFPKWLLLQIIRCYWWLIPLNLKNPCIFRISCSNHVFNATKDFGFQSGMAALKERWIRCRPGYQAKFINDKLCLHLIDGSDVHSEDLSEFIIKQYYNSNRKKNRKTKPGILQSRIGEKDTRGENI